MTDVTTLTEWLSQQLQQYERYPHPVTLEGIKNRLVEIRQALCEEETWNLAITTSIPHTRTIEEANRIVAQMGASASPSGYAVEAVTTPSAERRG